MFFVGNDRLEELESEAKQGAIRPAGGTFLQKINIRISGNKRYFIKKAASMELRQVC
jgi:hypothetical protein